ncbi:hypothetical protein ACFLSF_02985 [Candidatus Bipolaricaulota bacterium]
MRKKEEEKKEGEATLLQELCGADAELYAFLSVHLYETPSAAISQKNLDILTAEAEDSGAFRQALDKAIFEGTQNPGERERYIGAIQDLASKTMRTMERERETAEKEGLTDLVASLGRGIENQKVASSRAEDILIVASKFYAEKEVALGEDVRRAERRKHEQGAEREEKKILNAEEAARKARRRARRGMTRGERREAQKEDKRDKVVAHERKEAREQEKQEAGKEDQRIGELEKEGREARKRERRGNAS